MQKIKEMETRISTEIEESEDQVVVYGARVHNLRNINVAIPRNKLTVITGLSGSGKSSLAFDTIYAEGRSRSLYCFSLRPILILM